MLAIIVAYDQNRTIGFHNQLPWHFPADLARLKRLTMGKTIIMGRKTFLSIGKALPNRRNIVLTRNKSFKAEGVEVIQSPGTIISAFANSDETCFVFGGEEVFKLFLSHVQVVYATEIAATFEGDRYFPKLINKEWKLIHEELFVHDQENQFDANFKTFERRQNHC